MYSEALSFTIQCFQSNGTTSNGIDNATASGLTVSLTIPKLISIVTASPSPINFGNFSATSAQSQITVKSTSTLNVSVTSSSFVQSSLTQLVRSGAVTPYPANSVIPYTMKFNNVTIAPGTPLANHQRAGVSGSDLRCC